MTGVKHVLPLILVPATVVALTEWAVYVPRSRQEPPVSAVELADTREMVDELNGKLAALWSEERTASTGVPADVPGPVTPAAAADELTVLRRLSLALHGTIPSLEEVRRFEADRGPDRLERWTAAMLDDPRFSDYWAERLARGFVGVDEGQFLLFRRDRLNAWLSEQLRARRPYDEIVRELIAADGVWTGRGQVNFVTAGYANEEFDENVLAARTVRAFLGQRIDCAQCHDHPFDHWTQAQFEGIAAHYGQLRITLAGVVDVPEQVYLIREDEEDEGRAVAASLPFSREWEGRSSDPRERLARWLTHPENERFGRATANRVWGLMFGRPFAARVRVRATDTETGESGWAWTDLAVDELPDPGDPNYGRQLEILDLLGRDFQEHGYDLRRMIRVIAASQAFRMESVHPESTAIDVDRMTSAEVDSLRARLDQIQARWAVFPLIRLRPEQVIGSMLQANHVGTIDRNSHLFVRAQRFFRERDFINEFGDPGAEELEPRTGTVQQALLRMNGDFAYELSEEKAFRAPGQIPAYSTTPERLLENVFLSTLTRRPTQEERECFLPQLGDGNGRPPAGAVQDLYWSIFNSAEFSWNH